MRPLRLELKGFTAFRDTAELDLTDLDVFAISGPMGSGKSSLLDAMTYALYGRVERVGDRVSQLISQGQPRMAVSLEFEVGHDRYKVTRSTPSRGATKIQLMRWVEGEWKQAGEGSDRVRDVKQTLAQTIGLTYDGFTRSVLLPQGKFAEFMVGDPRKRREILTELLGHALFKRMAERAGMVGKESSIRAETLTGILDHEYADATPEAVVDAKRQAKETARREKALAAAAEQVIGILARWEESKRSIDELLACAEEAGLAASQATASAERLAALAKRLREAEADVKTKAARAKAAEQALEAARAALEGADAKLGRAADLAKAHGWADALAETAQARSKGHDQRDRTVEQASALAEALEAAELTLAEHWSTLAAREARLRDAEAGLEEARHADLVAAVSIGLKAGDPCPVCGLPLASAPKRGAAATLKRATARLTTARKELDEAREAAMEAEHITERARRDVETNVADQARAARELEEIEHRLAQDTLRLQAILGDPLPVNPVADVERRVAERQRLDQIEREASREAAEAAQEALKTEHETGTVVAQIERHRDRLAADRRPLLERIGRVMGDKVPTVEISDPPAAAEPDALEHHAAKQAKAMGTLQERLSREVHEHASLEARLFDRAIGAVGDLVEPTLTLAGLAEAVNAACRAATAQSATAAHRADELATRLERRKNVVEEVRQQEDRARLFKALAQELKADRLIAFLQAEALHLLAAAGSERLAGLSEGRYRLVCRDEEFLVVDTWNGDEERSVRTLSGGETFLASLALALALADQVRSLSVTDRARLDSLFLDEGFGTLDPEALRTVTDAIEQLGGDGRLVGVITHVKELAEQFPRIEVTKSPSGSRLQLVP